MLKALNFLMISLFLYGCVDGNEQEVKIQAIYPSHQSIVAPNLKFIQIVLDKAIDKPLNLDETPFHLISETDEPISTLTSVNGKNVVILLLSELEPSQQYRMVKNSRFKEFLWGSQDFSYTINTSAIADTTAPILLNSNPIDGAENVEITQPISFIFNEDIVISESFDPILLDLSTQKRLPLERDISGNVLNLRTFYPLNSNSRYQLTLGPGLTDLSSNGFVGKTIFFSTAIAKLLSEETLIHFDLNQSVVPTLYFSNDRGREFRVFGVNLSDNNFKVYAQTKFNVQSSFQVPQIIYQGSGTITQLKGAMNDEGEISVGIAIKEDQASLIRVASFGTSGWTQHNIQGLAPANIGQMEVIMSGSGRAHIFWTQKLITSNVTALFFTSQNRLQSFQGTTMLYEGDSLLFDGRMSFITQHDHNNQINVIYNSRSINPVTTDEIIISDGTVVANLNRFIAINNSLGYQFEQIYNLGENYQAQIKYYSPIDAPAYGVLVITRDNQQLLMKKINLPRTATADTVKIARTQNNHFLIFYPSNEFFEPVLELIDPSKVTARKLQLPNADFIVQSPVLSVDKNRFILVYSIQGRLVISIGDTETGHIQTTRQNYDDALFSSPEEEYLFASAAWIARHENGTSSWRIAVSTFAFPLINEGIQGSLAIISL
jgi:hypothetical protein